MSAHPSYDLCLFFIGLGIHAMGFDARSLLTNLINDLSAIRIDFIDGQAWSGFK